MWVGRIPRVNITDPELIKEVLTKYYKFQKNHHDLDPITKLLLTGIGSLEGDPWAKRRKIINAAFHFEKLKVSCGYSRNLLNFSLIKILVYRIKLIIMFLGFFVLVLKLMLPAFYLSCRDMVTKWDNKVPEGGSAEVDVWHDIETLTGDVISRTLFGSNFEEGRRIFELMKELTALTIDVIRSVYIPGQR